jgi:hypothetical protein
LKGDEVEAIYSDFPTVSDGARGMEFIEKMVESSQKGAVWVEL